MTPRTRHLFVFAACFTLCANAAVGAAESADSAAAKATLAVVRARIATVTARLGAQLKDRDALAARLRDADLLLTAKRQRLEALRTAQAATEHRRVELRVEETRGRADLDVQRAGLAAQVRAAYLTGRQEELKLLLHQSDPAAAGRTLSYYGYFVRARAAKIAEISERSARLRDVMAQIDEAGTKLKALQNDAANELGDVQRARGERVAALAALNSQMSTGNEELARLKREEQAKESLVAELARVLQDFPVDSQQRFDALRGRLPWPVPGTLGGATNGVQISAARGAKVRAPYFGRVVYADWLQGLGLLLIIGHSGNYMTLYGHAEVLYKSVGDWVAPGDVIAAMSDVGGPAPQLYFEIRNGRKTVDPKGWLKAPP